MASGMVKNDKLLMEWLYISNITISGSATTTDVDVPISKAGYEPIGVVGFSMTGTGSSQCSPYKQFINYDNGNYYAHYRIRNSDTAAHTVALSLAILWQRT